MTLYRKKPVVIEAVEFDGTKDSANKVLAWIGCNGGSARRTSDPTPFYAIAIETLEGTMTAAPGDFIIRGVQGEFYPCKPDIFAATYEPAEEEA